MTTPDRLTSGTGDSYVQNPASQADSHREYPATYGEPAVNGNHETSVSILVSRKGCQECDVIMAADISDVIQETSSVVWVNIRNPGREEIAMLGEEFGFHALALEDLAEQRQRPKVDEYPGYFFVVLYAPVPGERPGRLLTTEIDMFVGRNFVVTCHHGEVPGIDEAVLRWQRTDPTLREQVGFLVHVVADTIVDSYFPIVEDVEERLDRLELGMFQSKPRYDPEDLLSIKRTLYTLRKAVFPLREVFNTFLRRDQAIFRAETYPFFQDSYDHVLRLLDIIDIERDMSVSALETQLSVASNHLNETMKRLTVVAVCVAVMGAVFGAWGMNFDEVPLHSLGITGFALVWSATLGLVGIVLYLARRAGLW